MGHHQHGDPAVGEGFHHLQHFADHLRVERRGGLIEQDNLRRGGQGAGDGHPLLLAAGELRRHLLRFFFQSDLTQQRQRPRLSRAFFPAMNALQRQSDVLLRRQVGIKVELLEDKADAAAQLAQGAAAQLAGGFAVDQDLAAA